MTDKGWIFYYAVFDSHNVRTGIRIDHKKFIELLYSFGIRRFDISDVYIFVRIRDQIVTEVRVTEIQDELIKYIKNLPSILHEGITRDELLTKFYTSPGIFFNENKLTLVNGSYIAISEFPLTIDINTKELLITTPNGVKVVAILPEQAITNLINTGIINIVDSTTTKTDNALSTTSTTSNVKLEEYNNQLSYKVEGQKIFNFLGLVSLEQPRTVWVSVENGEVVAQDQSFLASLIEFLSAK